MLVAWLELLDFRSYGELRFEPDAGINILSGPNGAGKTNLVEAVAYLARLRSVRGAPDTALIAVGAIKGVIRGEFSTPASSLVVEVELSREARRRVLVNGKRPRRFSEVGHQLRTVAFLPDDLRLVKGGAANRRDYLDDLALQLAVTAGGDQSEYERALRQRNALLRHEGRAADAAALDVWDETLATAGAAIIERRLLTIASLLPFLGADYAEIAADPAPVGWAYEGAGVGPLEPETPPADLAERLQEALARRRRIDLERRMTTVGPHRDDIGLLLDGRDTRMLASQGEQRTLALGLRLAAFDLLVDRTGEIPLLLLDDVFSELDERRSAGVVSRLPKAQVFITTAREEDIPVKGRSWSVGGGVVE